MDLLFCSFCDCCGGCWGDSPRLSGISFNFSGCCCWLNCGSWALLMPLSLLFPLIFSKECFFLLKLNFTTELELLRLVLLLCYIVFLERVVSLVLLYFSKGSWCGLWTDRVEMSDNIEMSFSIALSSRLRSSRSRLDWFFLRYCSIFCFSFSFLACTLR